MGGTAKAEEQVNKYIYIASTEDDSAKKSETRQSERLDNQAWSVTYVNGRDIKEDGIHTLAYCIKVKENESLEKTAGCVKWEVTGDSLKVEFQQRDKNRSQTAKGQHVDAANTVNLSRTLARMGEQRDDMTH